jgi:hypothetical protein
MELLKRHGLLDTGAGGRAAPRVADERSPRFRGTEDLAAAYARALTESPKELARLRDLRGWTPEAIERRGVGVDEHGRVTFPWRDAEGTLVGLGHYLPDPEARQDDGKFIADRGSGRELFPSPESVDEGDGFLFLVEGEPDAMSLDSLGLPAVGVPGAKRSIRKDAERFQDRRVAIVFDCDDAGRAGANLAAEELSGIATDVRVLDLDPERERDGGYDIGDFVSERENAREELLGAVAVTPTFVPTGNTAPHNETVSEAMLTPKLRRLDVARMVTEPPPEICWRVDNVAADGALTMLFAEPGEGKSLLAGTFGAAVATGESIAGIATTRGKVLYIDAENGEWEIHRRVHALGLSPEGIEIFEAGQTFDLRSDWREVERLVDEHGADLLVLDSLRSLAPELEENDSGDAEAALGPIRQLAHTRGLAVILIHHTKKYGSTYRGNSAILAAVDIAYLLDRVDGDPEPQRARVRASPDRWPLRPVEDALAVQEGAHARGHHSAGAVP